MNLSAPSAPHTLLRDRLVVTAATILWAVGTALGTGLMGDGGVARQGEGLFSDHATLIAPAGPAFSIWGVIYLGLLGYVVWQWLPAADRSTWARVTRVPAAASIGLQGLWLLVVFAGWVWLSVVVMAGIVWSLGLVWRRTAELVPEGWGTRLLVAAAFGLYLGWICVATCANVASWLVGLGVPVDAAGSVWLTVFVLVVVVGLAALLMSRTSHRPAQTALAAAVVWGLAWVAVGRFTGELRSVPVAVAAGLAALAVAGIWALTVLRGARPGRA